MQKSLTNVCASVAFLWLSWPPLLLAETAPLTLGEPIIVPGTKGRFDSLQIDEKSNRLLAAHTVNKTLDIISLPDGKLIKSVSTGSVQEAVVDVDHNRYYASISAEKKLTIINRQTLEITGTVSLPGPADALAYNPKNGLVYVCHDDGEDVWVVDPGAQKIVTTIKIPTNPEFVVYDPITDKVFQNIKSRPVIIVIDPAPNSVAATWSTIPAESPHGLAVNPETHRLFSAGKNGKLVVLDSISGKSLGSVDIAEGVDQIAFDAGNKRIYCAAWQGKLTVLQENEEAVKSLGDVVTPVGTHTLAVDPKTHSVWIAFAKGEESYVGELKAR
ncbi:MAG TPA: YncE family protein [Chthoniobacterales bacterium]|nr:YncE family protein [Chthoniobacterales bacterium]